ncbi:MAG: hypothetical protein ABI137_04345 [Antricoccus sp.]
MTLVQMIEAGIPPRVATWRLDRLLLYTVADAYEGWRFGDIWTPSKRISLDQFENISNHYRQPTFGDSRQRRSAAVWRVHAAI